MINRYWLGGAASALAMVCAVEAHAQQTTAALRGSVVDASGAPVSGAAVLITHVPTGSVSTATTTATGSFFKSNLRVGGPFTITVTAAGFAPASQDGLTLSAGNPETANVVLQPEATDTIVVTGTSLAGSTLTVNNGVGSVFSAQDLARQPSINNDIIGAIATDPLVNLTALSGRNRANGTFTVAGQAPRFNGLIVDGLTVNNTFGLDQGVFPTLRQPLSNEWLEEFSVSAADYSVQVGGFTGGLINAVTKSGGNEIDGGIYGYYRDDSLVGDTAFGNTDLNIDEFEETEFGGYISGPVLQDRLFFFAGYEEFENTRPLNFDFGSLDPQVFDIIGGVIQDTYDYDPGSKSDTTLAEEGKRWLLKLDANITDRHRAVISYNRAEDNLLTNTGTFNFPTTYYNLSSELDFYRGELVSDWTDNFSTILRVSHREYVRGQDSLGDTSATGVSFGQFTIATGPDDPFWAANGLDGDALLGGRDREFVAGPDVFRHANAFEDEITQYFAQGEYVRGDHVITFGGEYRDYELFNLFGQFSKGEYEFGSIQDLANQTAEINYINAQSNNVADVATEWGYESLTLFASDSWQVNPDLSINFGVRYERYYQDDTPPAPELVPLADGSGDLTTFESIYGISGTDNLDGLDIIQPRFGFSYDATEFLTVSGGLGLYSGSTPEVWISNNFTPATFSAFGFGPVTGFDGRNVPQELQDTIAAGVGPRAVQNIDFIDPDFEIPSVLRASLRADFFDIDLSKYGFGDGYQVGLFALYGDQRDQLIWRNLAFERADLQATSVGVAPDGRPIYPDLGDIPNPTDPLNQDGDENTNGAEFGIPDAFLITNQDGGESWSLGVQVSNSYDFGLDFDVSYTYTEAEDLLEYTSSRAVSAWRGIIGTDRNNPELANSSNLIENKFIVRLGYERDFFSDLTSRVDLVGTIQSGRPFSYGYDVSGGNPVFGRANGGSPRDGADLLYIPLLNSAGDGFDDPRVEFAEGAEEEFLDLVRALNLEGSQGGIVDRNSTFSPWNQRFDFRFTQDLPGVPGVDRFVGDNRFKFVVDIENVLNLINDDWGTQYDRSGSFGRFDAVSVALRDVATGEILSDNEPGEFCKAAADCVFVYSNVADPSDLVNRDLNNSNYKIRFGLKYEF